MLRTVHLHGRLGKKFGKKHKFAVATPAEAIRALCEQLPGFRKYIEKREYALVRGKDMAVSVDTMHLGMGKQTHLHILPAGAMAGIETILIVGLGLIAASLVAVTLLAMPKAPDVDDREAVENNSYIFDGPVNVTEQGHPVPLVYGRIRTGSVVGSSGLDTTDVNEAGVGVGTGYVGSTPGIKGGPGGDYWHINLAKGGKGGKGGGRAAQEDPNSLQSQATARILDIVSEGEIVGLVDGLKSIYFDDTPLQNADNSFNFAGVAVQERNGLPTQDAMPGFAQTENTISVDTAVTIDAGPITRTVINNDADVARVTIALPRLYQQDTENGDLKATSVTVAIELDSNGSGYTEVVRHTFTGKTNSPYQRSFDIRLPAGQAPHNIRVKRISPDSELQSLQNETRFDLITEIVEAKFTYPNTAMVGLTVDARQFGTSIPTRSYDIKGLIIEVPTNYDPDTRTYTGVWDGTFKRAWTDNPAWVWRDIIVNKRYGLGHRVDSSRVDKWTLYSIAQYCDELVDDGFGGQEPRYTINVVINKARQAYDLLGSIASAFRGWAHWGSGAVMAAQDRPEDPAMLVTEANAVDGDFRYDRVTPLDQRRSVVLVQWNDPNDSYRLATEVIESPDLVRRFGWEPRQPVVAYGCTSRGQARRHGLFILEDESHSNAGVEYESGDDHGFIEPGKIIEIADTEFTGGRRGGRVKARTANQITVDSTVTLEAGQSYTLGVVMPDGTVSRRAVTRAAGDWDVLTLGGAAWGTLPGVGAVWTLESDTVANRRWRVRSIDSDEPPYKVRGILYDSTKYARVEQGLDISPDNYLALPDGGLTPPTQIDIREYLLKDGNASTPGVQVSWRGSVDPRVLYYQAQHKPPGGEWKDFVDSPSLSRELRNITPGVNSFRVRAVDALGRKTAWVVKDYTLGGQLDALPTVTGLAIVKNDDTLANMLVWNEPTDTRPLRYQILYAAANDINAATIIGITDKLESPVKDIGHYWVRTEFAGTVATTASHVELTLAGTPRPRYDNLQNAPHSLADLDSVAAADITQAQTDINNLFTTYGSTANAATSAAAAQAAQTASEAARDLSLNYRNAAQAAQAAAETAEANAETARDDSQAAQTAAEGARDTAIAQANAASGSATTAAGHATTATNQANAASGHATAAQAAATTATSKATEATNQANAAASHASSAATHATTAGNHASAADTSRVEASISAATVGLVKNGNFSSGQLSPWTVNNASAGGYYYHPTLQRHTLFSQPGYQVLYNYGEFISVDTSKEYTITSSCWTNTTQRIWLGLECFDGNGTLLGRVYDSNYTFVTSTVLSEWKVRGQGGNPGSLTNNFVTGTLTVKPVLYTNWPDPANNPPNQSVAGSYSYFYEFSMLQTESEYQAGQHASASQTSAANAAASETAAGQHAATATTQAGIATTKAGEASTSAANAASSETNAAGSAATATSQAGLATTARQGAETAETNAANSATQSANSATASASSASTAQSHANTAGVHASAANTSRISAEAASDNADVKAGRLGLTDNASFTAGTDGWSAGYWTLAGPITGFVHSANYQGAANVLYQVAGGRGDTGGSPVQYDSTRKYRIHFRYHLTAALTNNNLYFGYSRFDAANIHVGTAWDFQNPIATVGWHTGSVDILSPLASGTAQIVPWIVANLAGETANFAADYLYIEDVTQAENGVASANAAAVSATNAAASETNAGQSANTATTQAGIATTKAAESATSASNAATSETNAAGSAATATTQAGIATTARQNAETAESNAASSASAAAGSASSAASHATNAGNSAAAANADRIAAEAANTNAQTAATSANSSATAANADAATALADRNLTATFKTESAVNASTIGLTKNANFDAGVLTPWTANASTFAYNHSTLGWVAFTQAGVYDVYVYGEYIDVDTSREYTVTGYGWGNVTQRHYIGLKCYDGSNNFIGDVFTPPLDRGTLNDTFKVRGQGAAGQQTHFVTGTAKVKPVFWINATPTVSNGYFYLQRASMEDTEAVRQAASSASSAATDAATATAQAALATSERTLAASHASNAATSETNAAGSASAAAGSANASATSATASENSRVLAAAEAAAAQQSAVISAKVGGNYINRNPRFSDWTGSFPTGFETDAGSTVTKVAAPDGVGNAMRCVGVGTGEHEVVFRHNHNAQMASIRPNTKYVFFARCKWVAGASFNGIGGWVAHDNAAGSAQAWTQIDWQNVYSGNPVIGKEYTFTHVFTSHANAVKFRAWIDTDYVSHGGLSAKTIDWLEVGIKEASEFEAAVTTDSGVIVDVTGRTEAYLQHSVDAGNSRSVFTLTADGAQSKAAIVADEIALGDQDTVVLYIANGAARINNALIRGLQVAPTATSTVTHEVQLKPNIFLVSDGQAVSFGGDYGAIPEVIPDLAGLPALASGESYAIAAQSVSATGFTAKVKKVTAGALVAQNSGAGTNAGGTPQWRAHKPTAADSYNGYYQFTATLTGNLIGAEPIPGGGNIYEYQATGDIYMWNGSALVVVGQYNVGWINTTGASTQVKTFSIQNGGIVGQASGSGYEFGLHPTLGGISAFSGVAYSTQTQSNETAVAGLIPFAVHAPSAS